MHLITNRFSTRILALGSAALLLFSTSCKSEKQVLQPVPESIETVEMDTLFPVDSAAILQLRRVKEMAVESYKPSARRDFDLLHTELDLEFDWERQAVLGKARLRLKPYFYPQKIVSLDAKDYEVGPVYLVEGKELSKLSYRYDEKRLEVYLPKELSAADTVEIEINYTAFPERNAGNGSQAITDTKGLYFIDPLDTIPGKPRMIWTQGETEHNSKWFPTIDKPNERATQLFKLTVPDSMVSVSNGELVKQEALAGGLRRDHWELNLPSAPYLAAIAVGDFGKVEAKWGDIPLGYYVEKGFERGASKVFANTPEMMGFFEEKLGVRFPWPKYDQIVVRDFVSGAMENTTASIFMEELRLNEREAIDSEWDYIIAHELMHQWFGDLVTTESWANLTLNEAFANYSEYLWNEHKYGLDQAGLKLVNEMEGYFAEAETKQVDLIRFDYGNSEDMFDAHSYNKGGVILNMLRRQVGDEAFFKALNRYLQRHAFQSVEVHDLRMAFEEVTGQDLNWFFNQWFLDKGHPELTLEVDYSQPENILITARQVQDLEQAPLFQLPIEVSWYEGGERKSRTFQMTRAFQQFALENETPLSQVYLDEGKNLLARRSQEISSEQFARQFEESRLGVARYEALDSLAARASVEHLSAVFPAALQDSFWSVRESALGHLQGDPAWRTRVAGLEDRVYDLAENDPKNSVRAAALDLLTAWDPAKYKNAFLRLANDSSYLVASSALMGLVSDLENPVEAETIERFSGEDNFRIVIPVGEYYIQQDVSGKGDWFLDRLSVLSGEGLYYFMGYFSEYFVRFPQEGKQEAVSRLLSLMKNDSKNFVRMGAFQGLLAFSEDPSVVAEISRIAKLEEVQELKNYYQYFLETISDQN